MIVRLSIVVLVLVASVASAACEPIDPIDGSTDGDTPAVDDTPDPAVDRLVAALSGAQSTLEDAAATLEAAAAAATLDEARGLAGQAARTLTDAHAILNTLPGDDPDRGPFLPAEELAESDLTRLLAAALDAGEPGQPVLAALGEPVAGDLTTWQRAPDDRIRRIAEAAQRQTDEAIGELDGQVGQALAWTVVGARARDMEALRDVTARAVAHLAVAITALEDVFEDLR